MSRPERKRKPAARRAPGGGSRRPELVPPVGLAGLELGGPLRCTFLVWFDDPGERQAVEQFERMIGPSLAALEPAEPSVRSRVRAIVAELVGLRDVLADIAHEREGSSLAIPEWELARLAASAASAADSWTESIRSALGDADLSMPLGRPGDRPAFRETTLWATRDSPLADDLREVARMLFLYVRELSHRCGSPRAVAEEPTRVEESTIRRDLRATAVDLLHLASFAAATAEELPQGDGLRGLLDGLVYGLARWVERLCRGLEGVEKESVS